jgi:glycosyltransferase involved in cell wall biosynthesis
MNSKLVIVIPTKNRCALLERALGSVFSQTYEDYRVVVVNDGSTDGTREYLDALHDPRVTIVHHERSRGVNASRNEAYKSLQEGEWAVPLDDDDLFLPGAFETIARFVAEASSSVSVLQFNTIVRTRDEEFLGGFQFEPGEASHDMSYAEAMTGKGLRVRGEPRPAFKATLFPKCLFNETINGFEGEWWLLITRDGVGVRYVNTPPIVLIDWRHEGEHLSDTAARRNPGSFARAHARIIEAHRAFFASHPRSAAAHAVTGFKVAVRAFDLILAARFAFEWLRARFRILLGGAE